MLATKLNRRDALKSGAAVTAAAGLLATGTLSATGDERRLWERYTASVLATTAGHLTADEAGHAARQECETLECPWTPFGLDHWTPLPWHETADRKTLILMLAETVAQHQGKGPWLVKEYQSAPSRFRPPVYFCEGNPIRWQPYPDAKTAEEAYAASEAESDKGWRSYEGRVSAISRKHRVRPLKQEADRLFEAEHEIVEQIANVPITGPAGIALKLGLHIAAEGRLPCAEPTHGTRTENAELKALYAVYRHAADEAGFDPVADYFATPGV